MIGVAISRQKASMSGVEPGSSPCRRQHRIEGVDHEQPDPACGDLSADLDQELVDEPFGRVVVEEAVVDDVVGNAERPQSRQDRVDAHRVQVGPGDRVARVHLRLGEDHREPGLQRLGLPAEKDALRRIEELLRSSAARAGSLRGR